MSSHTRGNVHEHYLQKDIFKSCIVSPVLPPWNVLVLGKTRMLDSEKMATLPAVEEICHVQYLQNERLIFQYFNIFLLDEKCYECGNPLPIWELNRPPLIFLLIHTRAHAIKLVWHTSTKRWMNTLGSEFWLFSLIIICITSLSVCWFVHLQSTPWLHSSRAACAGRMACHFSQQRLALEVQTTGSQPQTCPAPEVPSPVASCSRNACSKKSN